MAISYEEYDDFILELEERMGTKLSSLDDRAIAEQNRRLKKARSFIPD